MLKARLGGVRNTIIYTSRYVKRINTISKRSELVVASLKSGQSGNTLQRVLLTQLVERAVFYIESLQTAQTFDIKSIIALDNAVGAGLSELCVSMQLNLGESNIVA